MPLNRRKLYLVDSCPFVRYRGQVQGASCPTPAKRCQMSGQAAMIEPGLVGLPRSGTLRFRVLIARDRPFP